MDGEWNSLCIKGNSRPLSVFQIHADVRSKYNCISMKKMVEMITPIIIMYVHGCVNITFIYITCA